MIRLLLALSAVAVIALFLLPESRTERRSDRVLEADSTEEHAAWPPAFDNRDPDRRRAAAWELRKQGDQAVPIFIRLLREGDADQKILAARSLGHMKKGRAALIDALDPDNTALCLVVLEAIKRIGTPKEDRWALPLLAHEEPALRLAALELLEARDAEVVNAVADLIDPARGNAEDGAALAALGYAPGGVAQILAAFENDALLSAAIDALERMGPAASPATSALVEVIRKEEVAEEERLREVLNLSTSCGIGWNPQYDAARALAAIGEAALPEVVAMLGSELDGVRGHAASILASIGDAALPALVTATNDPSPATRATAAAAIAAYSKEHPELLSVLTTLSTDPDKSVRRTALASMGGFGDAATPVLLSALSSTDSRVLDVALDSLRTANANDPRLIAPLARLLTHEDCTVQWGAADALGTMGTNAGSGITAMVEALDSADHYLRMSITAALVKIGPASLPALVARVDLASAGAQAATIEVFVKLGASSPEVRAACERLLQSSRPAIRVRAARLLAPFDAHRAAVRTVLVRGLEHADRPVRVVAVDGLRRMGAAAIPVLPDLIRFTVVEGKRDGNKVGVYDALAAVGVTDIAQLVSALAIDSWNLRYDTSAALQKIGASAVPHLVAGAPNLRPHTIPILLSSAKTVPAARAALAQWAQSSDGEIRFLALEALWKGTRAARAVVPGLLALAPSDPRAAYLLSVIGSRADFALAELRALHAKTKSAHIAAAILKIEQG